MKTRELAAVKKVRAAKRIEGAIQALQDEDLLRFVTIAVHKKDADTDSVTLFQTKMEQEQLLGMLTRAVFVPYRVGGLARHRYEDGINPPRRKACRHRKLDMKLRVRTIQSQKGQLRHRLQGIYKHPTRGTLLQAGCGAEFKPNRREIIRFQTEHNPVTCQRAGCHNKEKT